MTEIITAAILTLSPHLEALHAEEYARIVHSVSRAYRVDPFLVVAIIRAESDFKNNRRSRTNDYGLMQLHVSRTNFSELRGQEHLLYSPTLNLYLGIKHLRMFRNWHYRKCKKRHAWWRHYKWGFRKRFPDSKWVRRVGRFYRKISKFRKRTRS